MKYTLTMAAAAFFVIMSAPCYAQSITVTSGTLDEAEAKIAEKAQHLNAKYKITEANIHNRVHMTARLY
ncbi:DUF1471 domain-containing protein [Chimaeribacter coloradensis]|uniref:DUF1471 domain-containing protein n=1 Tax=Chimaeribacter coloradensis TaxID=2060068 RepID=A0A2N5E3U0_9GAMM|nr:DUF1471 domain-containing protein [Chimaeribacter coloradensis]PLR35501.1 DUF1471 domain-containing protein [Chimaeribacter coloradensis]